MKRILAAIAAMSAIAFLMGALLDLPGPIGWWLQPLLSGFLGAAVGGFVARNGFIPVALSVHALMWAVILYTLHAIAGGQVSYAAIATTNAGAITLSFALVALGAWVGQQAFRQMCARAAVANA